MGVRVEVRDGESVTQALKRFKYLVRKSGPPGTGVKRPKWHKNQLTYYLKPSDRRRRDELRDAWETYAGECARRRLIAALLRRTKRRKAYFGDRPVVRRFPR